MYKGLVIFMFCLLLIPFSAADILVRSVSGPDKAPVSDIVIPASAVEQNVPESSSPSQVTAPEKPFLEDPNPVPVDPKDLPQIVDKNEPKEANPTPVDMNPADFFKIVDKNEPRGGDPLPVDMNPNDFFKITDKNEPKEANPLPVESTPQILPPKSDKIEPKPDLQAGNRELPTLVPKFATGTEPREDDAPGAVMDPSRFFKITDKNEPKEENPAGVQMDPSRFFKITDRNEPKEVLPVMEPAVPVNLEKKAGKIGDETDPFGLVPDKGPLVDPDAYEPDNTAATAQAITVTANLQTQVHTLHTTSDYDWFRFYGVAGRIYSFASSGSIDTAIAIYNDAATTILVNDDNSGDGNNFFVQYTPASSAYFRIVVGSVTGATGTYGFGYLYVNADSYESDNTAATAQFISVTATLQNQAHTLHTNADVDWFRFYAYTGRDYTFYSTGDVNTRIYLYQDDGTTLIDTDDNTGDGYNFLLEFTPTSNAYYKFRIDSPSGVIVGPYTLYYSYGADPDGYEPDDSASDYTSITVYTYDAYQIHSLHNSSDQDWYRFYAIAGMTYTFWSTGNTDDIIYLYEDNGTTLIASDDQSGDGNNYMLSYTPTTTAFYKLKVVGYYGAIGIYYFYFHYVAPSDSYEPDDSSADYTYISPASYNQTQDHTLHSNTDQDWYRFYAYTGRYYTFYSTYNTDTQIYLYQDDGTTLLEWDDDDGDGLNFYLQYAFTANAYYKLKVVGFGGTTGYYQFNYSYGADPDAYEPDDSNADYTYISVWQTLQSQDHTIHSETDEDWYGFYAYTGRIYHFYSEGNTDTRIFLYQSDGTTQLDWDDDDGVGNNYDLLFAPTVNGSYFLKVDGYGTAVGAYVFYYVYGADPDSYEPDNSSAQFTTISVTPTSQSQDHTLHNTTDQDWYRFYGYTGKIYHFESTGNTDGIIYLYADDGTTLIASDDQSGAGNNFLLENEPTANAYYKLKVVGWGGSIGAYTLEYYYRQDADAWEPDDTSATATSFTVYGGFNTYQSHTLHTTTDQDWYRFYGIATGTYTFWSTGNTDTDIYLYQDNGTTQIDYDWDDGDGYNYYLQFTPTTTGYYKLKVNGYNGNNLGIGAYKFYYTYSAPADSYEPDNSATQFTYIYPSAVVQTQNRTIHASGDPDWIRFYAYTGRIYHFYSTTSGATDTRVYLYQDDGTTLISSDDDSGGYPNFSLDFSPTANAYYKLMINGFSSSQGFYEFNYYYGANPDAYEPDDSATDYTNLTVTPTSQSQDHTLHNGTDQDWYRFYGYAGRIYHFESTGNTDTKIYLYQSDGTTLIDWDDDDGAGNNFLLDYAPTTSAYYLLKVIPYNSNYAGAYTFIYYYWAEADSYEPDDTAATYHAITVTSVPQSQNHTIHTTSDQDWYRFYGTAGRIYNFWSTGNTDVDIYLYQDDGTTLIDYDYDDGDAYNYSLQYTPGTSAYYKLKVTSWNGGYNGVGAYVFYYVYTATPDTYEPDNSTSQFTFIYPTMTNQIQNHTLHNDTDQDWFRFYGYTGRIYVFYSTGTTDTRIWLYHDNGTTLIDSDDDDGDGNNFYLQFAPSSSAYYKLKVDGFNFAVGAYVFNYSYTANPDAYEPDNSATQYTSLTVTTVNQTQDHTLHTATDEDWFRFQGVPGRVYTFFSTGNTDTQIFLYQNDGTTLIESDDDDGDGYNFYLQCAFTVNAYYKLKVNGWGGSGGSYVFNYSYTTGLTKPINVQITRSGSNVTVTWNAVIGATSYKIQASDNPYSGFVQVGTSATTSWTGPATAARRFYRVIAMN